MIEAMCLYEVDLNLDPDPVYPRADAFNLVVSADIGDNRRWYIYAQTNPPVAEDSMEADLLRQAIVLFATRPERSAPAPDSPTTYKPRFHGIHSHPEVSPGVGCSGGSHHDSCQKLFGPARELNCVSASGMWSCSHEDIE